jgi:TolA-binding protein
MKYFVAAFLLFLGLRFGYNYLLSPEFQKYADENHSSWTCYVNNLLGDFYVTMSRYEEARAMYQPVIKRCAKTPMAERAAFNIAECLEHSGHRPEAIVAYRKFAEDYKGSPRARTAARSADILSGV